MVSRSSNPSAAPTGQFPGTREAGPEEDEYERRGARLCHNLLLAVKAAEVW
jgi:hypothetical protein